ncbi:AraC family transcriptional regulator [Fulvivirgaceae bacterium PWU4]|uniref:AraC family transcriptional regulator n=1 Tax=Chryseosolibacter histidini TaxID=2782349 RepID=A0AAP2DG04_9BACT|nr:AraC family transcriptional regulator [Chryseosolibacter histidini]MBT1695716.1 AraC family transcriptional regulator [Chryseosolibacter histidini]
MEQQQQVKHEHGVMKFTRWNCDNILLGHSISTFTDYVDFPASSPTDVIRLHFGMKGNYSFSYRQLNRSFDLIGSHHNIMWSNGFDMVMQNKTLEIETFGIQFPKDLFIQYTQHASDQLKRFTEDIVNGRSSLFSERWAAIDPGIDQVIQQIIHCRYNGDLKKLFLLSKSIELLVLSADAYRTPVNQKDTIIKSSTDKEKIIAVRDLINERVSAPPNLSEIAKTVGLNEYKLKRGFKETFNTTVFGYLTEQRLHLAHRYLRDTQKTAAQIALELGYATPQHFNNAFKKKFGITPYSVRNNP